MESLLSHSFDYLSSHDGIKVRKGLRQLEGLLAQICLSPQTSNGTVKTDRRGSVATTRGSASAGAKAGKDLADLSSDPAFLEFFKLQNGFEYNVAMRLILTLERLLSRSSTGANDLLIISTLDLLQGVLLIHPPSRSLFAREIYMNLLLDLLDPLSCPAIQSGTVLVLVTALLESPENIRCFERVDGLHAITSIFKSGSTAREVKMKIVEFFYFYLMPETPVNGAAAASAGTAPMEAVGLARRRSKKTAESDRKGSVVAEALGSETRSTEAKQAFLGKYLSNVKDLVEDLKDSDFGAAFA